MKARTISLILIAIILAVLACCSGCCKRNNTHAKAGPEVVRVTGTAYSNPPTVYEYKRDGKTYLIFRVPDGVTVIEHKTP